MRHAVTFMIIALAMGSALITTCTMSPLTGGTSTAENGRVSGRIIDPDGNPSPMVEVHCFAADGNPVIGNFAVSIDTTDENGAFVFDRVAPGNYNIQSVQLSERTRTLHCGISSDHDTTDVGSDTLARPGALECMFPGTSPDSFSYIYIPGTSLFAPVRNGHALIDSVPAGLIPTVLYVHPVDSTKNHVVETGVPIASGATETVNDITPWNYSRKLHLNTTASGAGVSGTVTDFPLLIRLSSENFTFNQAKGDGSDIRFGKADNAPLPYEIERWDAVNQEAEIWVTADTIYGNDSSQGIVMYWGNATAVDNSNAAAVFDTADGFIGVWHMNEDPSAGTASIKDRTANEHNATSFGSMTAANVVKGTVGKALRFDGSKEYLNAGNVLIPGKYSVGLWALLDTLGEYERLIFKNSSYTLWYDKDEACLRMEHMNTGTPWYGLPQNGGTKVPMTTGAWYYLVATFDGTTIRLYKNGVEASQSNAISIIPGNSSEPLFVGKSDGTSYVKGILDELRIEDAARSADWIRLCYMNQRTDDRLVVFVK
jgi:hypothetical protein